MAIDCCCALSKQDQSFLLTGNSHVILQNDSHVNLEPSHVMFSHVNDITVSLTCDVPTCGVLTCDITVLLTCEFGTITCDVLTCDSHVI